MTYVFKCGCSVTHVAQRKKRWWMWMDPCKKHAYGDRRPFQRCMPLHPTKYGAEAKYAAETQ